MQSIFSVAGWAIIISISVVSCKTPSISAYNTDETWNEMQYRSGENIQICDTAFLMVSNRNFTKGQLRFASMDIDTSQTHILYIGRQQNKWMVWDINSLREGIGMIKPANWVLYSEGMGKLFTTNVERAYKMQTTYGVNVILFDYASIADGKSLKSNYDFSEKNAVISYRQYSTFLNEVMKLRRDSLLFKNVSVSVFLHSMGNLMFREMMTTGLYTQFEHRKFIDNIICNAACVNRKNHHRWVDQIDFANHIYIHYNRRDAKLNGATFLSRNRKLGSKPKYPFSRKANYVDFEAAVNKNHNYFLNFKDRKFEISEEIKSYYRKILNGEHVLINRHYPPARLIGREMKK